MVPLLLGRADPERRRPCQPSQTPGGRRRVSADRLRRSERDRPMCRAAVRRGFWRHGDHRSQRAAQVLRRAGPSWTGCPSPSRRARSSGSSARTAPARRPPSSASRACASPTPAGPGRRSRPGRRPRGGDPGPRRPAPGERAAGRSSPSARRWSCTPPSTRSPADWRRARRTARPRPPSSTARFGKLSGGQKQRLFIALALIGNPRVVVLDELTTGLDPRARRDTWELIEDVRARGVTVLLVTHFMEEAQRLCDRDRRDRQGPGRRPGHPGGPDPPLGAAPPSSRFTPSAPLDDDDLAALPGGRLGRAQGRPARPHRHRRDRQRGASPCSPGTGSPPTNCASPTPRWTTRSSTSPRAADAARTTAGPGETADLTGRRPDRCPRPPPC